MRKNQKTKKQKIKKPKYILRGCLLRIFATIFVLIAITLGGGYFVLDRYLQTNCEMSLSEAYGILNSALSSNGKNIVTNPYKTEDLNGFYNNVTNQLFIDGEKYKLDSDKIKEIIDSTSASTLQQSYLFKTFGGKITSNNSSAKAVYAEENVDPAPPIDTPVVEEATDPILAIIADIFTRDNFELDRLSQYSSENHDDFLLKLSDRNIGAFLNDVLAIFLPQSTLKALIPLDVDSDISITVEQVILSKESRAVVADGVSTNKDVGIIKLTLSVGLDPLIESLMKSTLSSVGFLEPFIKAILPETLFVTAEMGLNYDIGANIFINNMNTQEMSKLYQLVGGITKATGTEIDLQTMINEQITSTVYPIVNDVATYLDFSKIVYSPETGGVLSIDMFDAVIKLAKINDGKTEADHLTSPEIITTMKGILTSNSDNIIKKPYEGLYKLIASDPDFVFDGELDDKDLNFKYIKEGVDLTKFKLVDYKQEFMTQLENKYLLDFSNGTPDTIDDITFDKLMSMFGIGDKTNPDEETKDLIDLFDPSKLGGADGILGKDDLTVRITDRMMAAIVDSQIASLIGGDSGLPLTDLKLKQLVLDIIESGDADAGTIKSHNTMMLTLSVPSSGLIGSAVSGVAAELISNLLPPMIYFTVEVDITLIAEGIFAVSDYLPTKLRFNSLTNDETDQLFETIRKVAGDALQKQALIDQIEKPMRDIMPKMMEIISVTLGQSSIIMPDIFQFMADKVINVNAATDEDKVSGEELKTVLSGIDEASHAGFEQEFKKDGDMAKSTDNFMKELKSKYYLNANSEITFDSIMDGKLTFDSDLINLDGVAEDTKVGTGILNDARNTADLAPHLTQGEFAYILANKIGIKGMEVIGLKITVDANNVPTLTLYIKLATNELFPPDSMGTKLLGLEHIYVKATTTLGETAEATTTDIAINSMTDSQLALLEKILKTVGGTTFSFESKADEISERIFENLVQNLNNNIEGGLTYENGKVIFPTFYAFMVSTLNNGKQPENKLEKLPTETKDQFETDVKAALQGINDKNYNVPDPISEDKGNSTLIRIVDNYFGHVLSTEGKLNNLGVIKQFSVLQDSVVLMSLKVKVENELSTNKKFLPEYLVLNIYIDMSTNGIGNKVLINNLNDRQQEILFKIVQIQDVSKYLAQCREILDETHASFSEQGYVNLPRIPVPTP